MMPQSKDKSLKFYIILFIFLGTLNNQYFKIDNLFEISDISLNGAPQTLTETLDLLLHQGSQAQESRRRNPLPRQWHRVTQFFLILLKVSCAFSFTHNSINKWNPLSTY